jgi:histidinol-phosphate/aromatic aminotransferase/cobyric acid decarboxylase-like protein
LVCDALPELLASVDLAAWAEQTRSLRGRLDRLLRQAGFDPAPSDANWLLVHAPGLRERLAPERVLVRDCASFGLPGTVRIAVPGDEGLRRLARALESSER